MFGGVGLFRTATSYAEILKRYRNRAPDDWLENRVYTHFRYLGVGITGVLNVLLFGSAGLIIFAVQMVWIPFWDVGVINGLGHF